MTLALSWPPGATAMQLSQDPGFAGAGQQPLAAQLEWTLADRAPEVVRVRFLGGPGGALQDSIRLDTTRPRVRRATVDRGSRRVRLRVTDSVSGVASVQLAADWMFAAAIPTVQRMPSARLLRILIIAAALLVTPAAAAGSPLTEVAAVPGMILDATPQRILYVTPDWTAVRIRDLATGEDTTVPLPAGRTLDGDDARLIPGGAMAILEKSVQSGQDELIEWRGGGTITNLGPVTSNQFTVAGDYAIWSVGSQLYRRQISTATTLTVATGAGTDNHGVAPNGDVVFWSGYNVYRWRDGVVTLMSDAPSTHRAIYPRTDGAVVVFARNSLCCGNETASIAFNSGAGETALDGSARADWAQPPGDYLVGGGWIAYTRLATPGTRMEIWTRSPSGALAAGGPDHQAADGVKLLALAPDGQAMYHRYAWQHQTTHLVSPGQPAFPLGTRDEQAFHADGRWYVVRRLDQDRTVGKMLRVELDTAITRRPPPMTEEPAIFELASSASEPAFECRLDGGDWTACESTKEFPDLADGEHTFEARSSGAPGGTDATPATATWRLDRHPPDPLVLTAPGDGATFYSRTVKLAWQPATDSGSGIAAYHLKLDSVTRTLEPDQVAYTTEHLEPGTHNWQLRAIDGLGRTRDSETRTFVVVADVTPPQPFGLVSPPAGAVVTDTTPELAWEAAVDGETSLDHYRVLIDAAVPVEVPAGTTSFTPPEALAPGRHEWSVTAVDERGNGRAAGPAAFEVDTQAPVAALAVSPTPALTGATVTFDAAGSHDPDTRIVRYDWDLDGDGGYEHETTEPTATRSYDTPGTRTIGLRVTDAAGRTATTATSLTVTPAPTPGPPGVSIHGGATFTNDPHVTITVRWPAFTHSMLIANDGGFGGAVDQPLAAEVPWTLDSSGAERLPKTVYVQFLGGLDGNLVYQDDIILDETPPLISGTVRVSAAARRAPTRPRTYRVRLQGGDPVSGVAAVQVTANRARPGAERPWARTLRVRAKRVPRWVRAYDRAGNRSGWRRIARRRVASRP